MESGHPKVSQVACCLAHEHPCKAVTVVAPRSARGLVSRSLSLKEAEDAFFPFFLSILPTCLMEDGCVRAVVLYHVLNSCCQPLWLSKERWAR